MAVFFLFRLLKCTIFCAFYSRVFFVYWFLFYAHASDLPYSTIHRSGMLFNPNMHERLTIGTHTHFSQFIERWIKQAIYYINYYFYSYSFESPKGFWCDRNAFWWKFNWFFFGNGCFSTKLDFEIVDERALFIFCWIFIQTKKMCWPYSKSDYFMQ